MGSFASIEIGSQNHIRKRLLVRFILWALDTRPTTAALMDPSEGALKRAAALLTTALDEAEREHGQAGVPVATVGSKAYLRLKAAVDGVLWGRAIKGDKLDSVAIVVDAGDRLVAAGEDAAGLALCFSPCEPLLGRGGEAWNLRLCVRCKLAAAAAAARLCRATDEVVQFPQTLNRFLSLARDIQQATQMVLDFKGPVRESHYDLVFNGTVRLFELCDPLRALGFARQVADFLVWAILAVESCLKLCSTRYVKWRARLYESVCRSYEAVNNFERARAAAKRGLQQVERLQALEALQVPVPAEIEATLGEVSRDLRVLLFKFDALLEHTPTSMSGDGDGGGGGGGDGDEDGGIAGGPVGALLQSSFEEDGDRVRACYEALSKPGRRILNSLHQLVPATAEERSLAKSLVAAAVATVEPHLPHLVPKSERVSLTE